MDEILKIEKTVWVRRPTNRNYSVDRHKGKDGKPDFFVLTEHKTSGQRFKVVILEPDLEDVINALQKAAR